ncbi:5-(carboxyamino)imidazole ribonucleotide synthase [Elongatibacter sediminis]|uniref:N5-carboxyaminoimidazole ribonucleotide synthase n=1 Tax=Elongatibacter sediminis TaxID=3119006 RepID=A0AAW9RBM4_9GAMM
MSDSGPGHPVRRIGILGGGQLARMMALAGVPLGFHFDILDPAEDACAGAAGRLVRAGFDDADAAAELAGQVDVMTYDFENVPATTAGAAAGRVSFHPCVTALDACQDRLAEKNLLTRLGIPVPPFHAVDGRTDLLEAVDRFGYPCVLKTRRFGYDGKGQAVLRGPEDLEHAWQELGDHPLIAEAFVAFDAECSLIAVRARDGRTGFWPLSHNLHDAGMLVLSEACIAGGDLQAQAEDIGNRLIEHFDYVGVIAVEFFVTDGRLSVNEIAPRVHNSGHWTIDGAVTSQFENHLRAISGLPLGSTALDRPSVMFNWIGAMPDAGELLGLEGLHWHDYGKKARPGRKVGHATLVLPDEQQLGKQAQALAARLGGAWPDRWSRFSTARGRLAGD